MSHNRLVHLTMLSMTCYIMRRIEDEKSDLTIYIIIYLQPLVTNMVNVICMSLFFAQDNLYGLTCFTLYFLSSSCLHAVVDNNLLMLVLKHS